MGIGSKLLNWLIAKPQTANYRQFSDHSFMQMRDLPLFTFDTIRAMLFDPTVRLGLAMRAAPLSQAQFAHKEGEEWVDGIKSDNEEVAIWVHQQLRRIWDHELHKLTIAQVWGWSGCEVTYRLVNGHVEVDCLLHRHARDVRALTKDGEVHGVRFDRIKGHTAVSLRFPRSTWLAFNAEGESPYGTSILKGSYSPWADKWLNGGALDVRRLFMHKDAYGGVDLTYPPGTTNIDGKGQVPNRDIAREIGEQIKAGGVTTRPAAYDTNGKPLWELTRASIPGNPTHILDYPKDLDTEILRGMEIPDDVITAEASGAWQGKQVPMQAFYTSADNWLAQIVRAIVTQLLEPLVLLNWGSAIEFEVETKPLAEQAMDQIKSAEGNDDQQEPGQPGQPRQEGRNALVTVRRKDGTTFQRKNPHFMSLDTELAVGRGLVNASELLKRRMRLASDCGATGGPGGGFQLKNTCWQLSAKQKEKLREKSKEREQTRQRELQDEKERVLQEQFDELGRDLEEQERQETERQVEAEQAAIQKAEERRFKRSKLFRDISETLSTDDPETIQDFRGLMGDMHGMLSSSAQEYNNAFDELVDQIIGKDVRGRQNRGAFVSQLKRASDPTKVPKFDEVVQYVRDNPEVGAILEANLGESAGVGDLEAMVFQGLRNGKKQVPSVDSDAVWNAALEFVESLDPGSAEISPPLAAGEPVPFSLERIRRARNELARLRMARAPKGGISIAGKDFAGGEFIPGEALDDASPEELAAVEGGGAKVKQTDTPEFKKWFGKSKVVDENGEPLRVFHGTTGDSFNVFEPERSGTNAVDYGNAVYFTADADSAADYSREVNKAIDSDKTWRKLGVERRATEAKWKKTNFKDNSLKDKVQALLNQELAIFKKIRNDTSAAFGERARVLPAYLKLENPHVVDAGGRQHYQVNEQAISSALDAEADGVIIRNVVDSHTGSDATQAPIDLFVVFNPTQIKSATGNKGTFDPDNPDIRMGLQRRRRPYASTTKEN